MLKVKKIDGEFMLMDCRLHDDNVEYCACAPISRKILAAFEEAHEIRQQKIKEGRS